MDHHKNYDQNYDGQDHADDCNYHNSYYHINLQQTVGCDAPLMFWNFHSAHATASRYWLWHNSHSNFPRGKAHPCLQGLTLYGFDPLIIRNKSDFKNYTLYSPILLRNWSSRICILLWRLEVKKPMETIAMRASAAMKAKRCDEEGSRAKHTCQCNIDT